MGGMELFLWVAAGIVLAAWAAFAYLRAFSGERVGAVAAMEEELQGKQRYQVVVRRSVHGPRGLRTVRIVMGTSAPFPSAIFILNQVQAAKAADAIELAAQAAEQR